MGIKRKFPLKELLRSAIRGELTEIQRTELVKRCAELAEPLVNRIIRYKRFNPDFIGLTESDIVYDSIADLFQPGENNELTIFVRYFGNKTEFIEDSSEQLLLASLRRLVFRKVKDRIFRLHRERDPALSKILRNIKGSAVHAKCFSLIELLGEDYFVLTTGDILLNLPEIPDDEVKDELSLISAGEKKIPAILDSFASFLSGQTRYRRRILLMQLAIAIKLAYEQGGYVPPDGDAIDQSVQEDDARILIHEACLEVANVMRPRYVGRGKVDGQTFCHYFIAIEQILTDQVQHVSGSPASTFEYLKRLIPSLVKEDYEGKHQVVVDYLLKLTKTRIADMLNEDRF